MVDREKGIDRILFSIKVEFDDEAPADDSHLQHRLSKVLIGVWLVEVYRRRIVRLRAR
ncbi:MAG: hypothetical protein JAY64_21355 [Candidatus Thiodiazotropha weberae]|nr:hypothetical protein [Candidatus Thiodiazotropha lotti]MCW4213710.1 hypothetical protein [Candidatus Thiodiazotropha lotti]